MTHSSNLNHKFSCSLFYFTKNFEFFNFTFQISNVLVIRRFHLLISSERQITQIFLYHNLYKIYLFFKFGLVGGEGGGGRGYITATPNLVTRLLDT